MVQIGIRGSRDDRDRNRVGIGVGVEVGMLIGIDAVAGAVVGVRAEKE